MATRTVTAEDYAAMKLYRVEAHERYPVYTFADEDDDLTYTAPLHLTSEEVERINRAEEEYNACQKLIKDRVRGYQVAVAIKKTLDNAE